MNKPWPYDLIFKQPQPGLIKQVMITYEEKDGKIVKETVTRNYYGADDYQDSTQSEVLYAFNTTSTKNI